MAQPGPAQVMNIPSRGKQLQAVQYCSYLKGEGEACSRAGDR